MRDGSVLVPMRVLVFVPVPFLTRVLVLPAVAWLALFGQAVPAAMVERLGFRAALERGRKLALADNVPARGSRSPRVGGGGQIMIDGADEEEVDDLTIPSRNC